MRTRLRELKNRAPWELGDNQDRGWGGKEERKKRRRERGVMMIVWKEQARD